MISRFYQWSFCGLILLVISSCATPTTPSGGPADEEGPKIVDMNPESGATNFSGREIKLSFSEFVNRESFRRALAIEPDIGLRYSLNWRRKTVEIEFNKRLPDSTTVIINIGTDLQDTRSNKISEPVRIALSTGPEIDEGEIHGSIVDARTGERNSGYRVFLYRSPFDLSRNADYAAETDTSGRFHFSYLRKGEYKVFWINDQNRNKMWDRERERAQPFYRETVTLEKAGRDTLSRLYLAESDTIKPALQGVGLFSARRVRIRFSENIRLTDSTGLIINDTLGNKYTSAEPLYLSPNERYVLFAQSGQELGEGRSFQLAARNIRDEAGNVTVETRYIFEGSSQRDTTQQRIIRSEQPQGMYPDEPHEVTYSKPITGRVVLDSLIVVEGTELHRGWPHLSTEQNRLRIQPPGTWQQGVDYEIRAWDPQGNTHQKYTPNIWYPPDYGTIHFALADTTDKREYRLRLISGNGREMMADTTFAGSIEIGELPPLTYRCIIYADLNDDRTWDPGEVEPYRAPEPYFIQNNIPVREGFTSDVTVTLHR